MIGTDIIEIKRIKNAIEKYGDHFLNKIYTSNEQIYCEKFANKYERYAARFAAKEAVAKIIQTGPKNFWLDIEIQHNKFGAPIVNLSKRIHNNQQIQISLSHCKEYALAVAIATN